MPVNTIISAKNIKKSYGQTSVLHGVSLDVKQGEVLAIMGPSGSGNRHCSIALRRLFLLIAAKSSLAVATSESSVIINAVFYGARRLVLCFNSASLYRN